MYFIVLYSYSLLHIQNGFIGNTAHYWECSENWLDSDNFPAKHPPCGEDTAVFEEVRTYTYSNS